MITKSSKTIYKSRKLVVFRQSIGQSEPSQSSSMLHFDQLAGKISVLCCLQTISRFISVTLVIALFFTCSNCGGGGSSTSGGSEPESFPTVKKMTVLDNDSGRVDWSPDGTQIAYDKIGQDGFADVWIMDADGMNRENLTDGIDGLPGKHMGQPAWHPSGEWIVFQAEKASHSGASVLATPGVGKHNDLWVINGDGSEHYQLTSIEEGLATLHPHFSHDGTRLLWVESTNGSADWIIKIADFVPDQGNVHLENVESLRPGDPSGPVFYETHGFSPDDTKIIFSANLEPDQDWTGIDIYTFDLIAQKLQRLTTTLIDWDEHAHYSPDGKWIVWMSSVGYPFDYINELKTDFWIMSADGSRMEQLTYFNDPNAPEYTGEQIVCGDNSWSPDGTKLACYVFSIPDHGRLIILHFEDNPVP